VERNIEISTRFKRDLKRLRKRNKDLSKLEIVVALLRRGAELPEKYRNHPLRGNWVDHMDCHLEPDWLLLYQMTDKVIYLVRTGTHADIFKK
jgi:mRNA interferase YafQ